MNQKQQGHTAEHEPDVYNLSVEQSFLLTLKRVGKATRLKLLGDEQPEELLIALINGNRMQLTEAVMSPHMTPAMVLQARAQHMTVEQTLNTYLSLRDQWSPARDSDIFGAEHEEAGPAEKATESETVSDKGSTSAASV